MKLRPVTYNWQSEKYAEFIGTNPGRIKEKEESYKKLEAVVQTGFIAQEVEQAAKQIGYNFNGVHAPTNPKDNYSIAYDLFIPSLTKAIQEQQGQLEKQAKENEALKKKNEQLENDIKAIKAKLGIQ
jgi:hypothetical protein